jgi:hypothetical protein
LTGFEKTLEVLDNTNVTVGLSDARYASYLTDQDTLLKRLGELRMFNQQPERQGIWARIRRGSESIDTMDGQFTMFQIGYDWKSFQERYTGFAFNHTTSSYDFAVGYGEGSQDALTLYQTWLGDKEHYYDIFGKVGKMRGHSNYYDSLFAENGDYDNWFYSLSYEYGRKNKNANGYYYELQAQLTWGHIARSSYTTA